ncbi:hypothetical protein CFP56_001839 [Quercus suber]|uniref:Zinc knuckle CX2CX4HX4C domain-containing protein n=1 Tax=Quercus suber TaxID=58331 RepID=A0AAW0ILH2_QUESU
MTPELGRSIGSSIGKVVRVVEFEEKGTIGRSLRGRKLRDNGVAVGWVSFRYERLPNFCYWCGCLLHEDRECDLGLVNKGKTPLEQRQFGPWLRAETDYHFRKPWSSGVGSEREEASQARQTMSSPVQGSPSSCLSGMGDDAPRAMTTQPDKVTRVGEPESSLHKKPLLEDSKRFDETLQWIDRELGLPVDYVAPPLVNPLEVVLNAKSNPTKKLPADKFQYQQYPKLTP